MKLFSVTDLQTHASELIDASEAGNLALVTRDGRPLFVAVPIDEMLLRQGLYVSLAVRLFDANLLTRGEAARLADLSLAEFFSACSDRKVPVVRYEAGEVEKELENIERVLRPQ